MFGSTERLRTLIEDARHTSGVTANRLSIVRTSEGRASYRQGNDEFRILLGDRAFETLNYEAVPPVSRPAMLRLHNENNSAHVSILHELMHVVIAGQPETLAAFQEERQWGTETYSVELGPQDGRRSFAQANLMQRSGPEEDLVIAMALYAYAYAPDAPETYRLFLEVIHEFHMTYVWTALQLPHPAPGMAAQNAANTDVTVDYPECPVAACVDMPR